MSKNLSIGLVVAGIILIVIGVIFHYTLKVEIFPLINVIIGVIGLILAAVGAWGIWSGRQAA